MWQETESLIYSIDIRNDDIVAGMVINRRDIDRTELVDILIDNNIFATMRCVGLVPTKILEIELPESLKSDLPTLRSKGELACSFSYKIPPYVPRGRTFHVAVRASGHAEPLFERATSLDQEGRIALRAITSRMPRLRFHARSLEGNRIGIAGSYGGHAALPSIEPDVQGMRVLDFAMRPTAVPADRYHFDRDVPWNTFEALVEADAAFPEGGVFRMRNAATGTAVGGASHGFFVPPRVAEDFASWRIPEPSRIRRVMGYHSDLDYYFGGYASFCTIEKVLLASLGRPLQSFRKIVDWGSGSGRVTQHFLRRLDAVVVGIDIDADNVSWCDDELPGGSFHVSPLLPPAPVPDGSADLIVGVSVFTHLDAPSQFAWLAELHRILAADGIAVVSASTAFSLHTGAHPVQRYRQLEESGIDWMTVGDALDSITEVKKTAYYKETLHSHEYINRTWSEWFDVVDIFIGSHFDYQDFFVLKKSSTPRPRPRLLM